MGAIVPLKMLINRETIGIAQSPAPDQSDRVKESLSIALLIAQLSHDRSLPLDEQIGADACARVSILIQPDR